MNRKTTAAPVALLCPKCGLCCNGVLFADVKLQKGDAARRLAELGLELKKQGRKTAFPQPCAGFDGTLCRIYADRPRYCRAFECGLLKRVQAGEMGVKAALKIIADARRRVEKVRRRLRRLGQNDGQLALIKRYARVMREPVDLSASEMAVEGRGKLMLAVNDLMQLLQRDFLQ